ncbi:MAG: asparagine synthase (glutamine-hydrolyzing) [Alphaproteobacteria bacterium]|nr:asparagine synthase (glutamine-hydrolyzing) [Alphaproteobacteria bacterium]
MCGVAGFLQVDPATPGSEMSRLVRRMADTLRHRGPDSDGEWIDPEAGIALGHRRLAIIDLSAEGAQPMASANGRYVIAYNGEVYNFPELRRELTEQGAHFRGHSDTEVMLAAIEAWGLEAAIGRFVGMFAFALWDRRERQLSLARDRLGIKPMYYARMGGHLLFASELRALRMHPAFAAEIDRDALALYLRRNCLPTPYSIYQGASKLPPATILQFPSDGTDRPRSTAYWSLQQVAEQGTAQPFDGDENEAVEQLEELLGEAVGSRMVADVPLGVFLSGGVDSSTVAALMQARSAQPIKTFSIGLEDAAYDEAIDAKAVAAHLGTRHDELYLSDDDALAVVPQLAEMYDEPFSDSSQIPTHLVSKMARRKVTVVLSGDGGDEVFAGYNRHLWVERIIKVTAWLPGPLKSLAADLLTALPPHRWDLLAGLLRQRNPGDKLHKLARVLHSRDAVEMYDGLTSNWLNADAVVLRESQANGGHHKAPTLANLPDFTRQMMYLDAMGYLPDDILTKVDRASMAVSLEARVPLLDHRVVAFAWRLPLEMKLARGQSKRLLRQVLYRHVPRRLIERPKMGFSVPIHTWLRGPLRGWAEELLSEGRLRRDGFFDPDPVRRVWAEHLSGRRNLQHQLWDVLMFQAWLDTQRG